MLRRVMHSQGTINITLGITLHMTIFGHITNLTDKVTRLNSKKQDKTLEI